MKKKLKYLIMVGVITLLPIKAKALTGQFKLTCNDTNLKVGRSTKCTLSGRFDSEIYGLEFSISKSDEMAISNLEIKPPFTKLAGDTTNVILSGVGSANTDLTIATFDVKLNSDITNPFVTTYDLSATASDYSTTYEQEPITVNFTNSKSTDATLKSITVGSSTVNVSGNNTVYEFTTNNSVSKVLISAVTNDTGASVIGGGEKDLAVGLNTFTLTVEAEDGTPKEYTIKITRLDKDSGKEDITPVTPDNTNNSDKTPDNKKSDASKNKTVKNPKTGIYSGFKYGLIIIAISGMCYILVRKEKYFNK